jgi:hypothetical protein
MVLWVTRDTTFSCIMLATVQLRGAAFDQHGRDVAKFLSACLSNVKTGSCFLCSDVMASALTVHWRTVHPGHAGRVGVAAQPGFRAVFCFSLACDSVVFPWRWSFWLFWVGAGITRHDQWASERRAPHDQRDEVALEVRLHRLLQCCPFLKEDF